jgi:hypothetical protein
MPMNRAGPMRHLGSSFVNEFEGLLCCFSEIVTVSMQRRSAAGLLSCPDGTPDAASLMAKQKRARQAGADPPVPAHAATRHRDCSACRARGAHQGFQ